MKQWEYSTMFVEWDENGTMQETDLELDEAGADGWELIQVIPHSDQRGLAFFKREKVTDE